MIAAKLQIATKKFLLWYVSKRLFIFKTEDTVDISIFKCVHC